MKLFEYEAKEIARSFGLPVPHGSTVTDVEEALRAFDEISPPVVLKGQVLSAGRMKAGGVLFASSKDEVVKHTKRLLQSIINKEPISKILIEKMIIASNELYAGILVDREHCCYLLLASRYGGSDVEELAKEDPSKVIRKEIDPLTGFGQDDAEIFARMLGYSGNQLQRLGHILVRLHEIATKYDAELVEVNPLVETPEGEFVLADLKLIIDDNALFRHPELSNRLQVVGEFTDREIQARKYGLSYVELDGDIGVLGNGAGLVMATLDLVAQFNGLPANFCDVGGGADTKRVEGALTILLGDDRVKVVLINILGGITRCDEVALGIVQARKRVDTEKPLVVRMVGTFEDEGKKILREASIPYFDTMEESAQEAVRLARGI